MKQIFTIEIEKTNEEWAEEVKSAEAQVQPHTIDSILDAARSYSKVDDDYLIRKSLGELGNWMIAKIRAEKVRALATKDNVDLDILIGVV